MQNALVFAGLIAPAARKTRAESGITNETSLGRVGQGLGSIHIAQPALSFGHVSG